MSYFKFITFHYLPKFFFRLRERKKNPLIQDWFVFPFVYLSMTFFFSLLFFISLSFFLILWIAHHISLICNCKNLQKIYIFGNNNRKNASKIYHILLSQAPLQAIILILDLLSFFRFFLPFLNIFFYKKIEWSLTKSKNFYFWGPQK